MSFMPQDFLSIHVLVVEDNKINQLLVKNMLKKFGILYFDAVENGNIALKKLAEKKYDLILMDIQMPELNGYEITRLIRKNAESENRNIPIIALTGDSLESERKKARDAGMNEYLVKPFTTEELYATMLKCLGFTLNSIRSQANEIPMKNNSLSREMNPDPGIDLRFLEKFTGGDLTLTVQLIETFLRDVPEAVNRLEELIPEKKWKEVHAVAHKIKSCIAIFELNDLKKNTALIESLSKDVVEVHTIPELFVFFKSGCSEAINNLEKELRKMNGDHN